MAASNGMINTVWQRIFSDPQVDRLRAALWDAERRLDALRIKKQPPHYDQIVQVCDGCLRRAKEAEARCARYVAWDCLHQFEHEMLVAMSDEERAARWCTLRAEAKDKLKGSWRSEAADCIIKQAPEDKEIKDKAKAVPLDLLRELHAHLATTAQNQQHKFDLFQNRSLPWLTLSLASTVLVALAISLCLSNAETLLTALPWLQALEPWAKGADRWARALMLGIPAGALGGILSMAFSLGRADLKAKIPDVRLSRLATLTRPLLGATVAIPVLVFIEAGYVKVEGFTGGLAIFSFCFLGGFSERWFLGVMERFETGKK